MARYIDIHVIQSVPFSNLNRDDTGAPKTAVFGGAPRGRFSSQACKRATRERLEQDLATGQHFDRSERTRNYVEHLAEIFTADGSFTEAEATHVSKVAFKNPAKKFPTDKDGDPAAEEAGKARVLMFLTQTQYHDIAAYIRENREAFLATPFDAPDAKSAEWKKHRKAVTELIAEPRGVVRLFGRMLAHLPVANTDSAIQVAHAITTHRQETETDYLTAVDDHPRVDEDGNVDTGAGMILTAEYASGTFYRYATINLDTLGGNGVTTDGLPDLAVAASRAFIESMPSGKQSASAAHTRASLVAVQVRTRPASLVNAFERPVSAGNGGYIAGSLKALAEHARASQEAFGETPQWAGYVTAAAGAEDLTGLGERLGYEALLVALHQTLRTAS